MSGTGEEAKAALQVQDDPVGPPVGAAKEEGWHDNTKVPTYLEKQTPMKNVCLT